MQTLNAVLKRPSAYDSLDNYVGETEFPEFYVVVCQNRDSDCLARSNFRSALKLLGGESSSVVIHRFGHWACGWWEALCVLKDTPTYLIAELLEEDLEDYPVVDDEDFSNLEQEEADYIWKNCYNNEQRITYMRTHKSEIEPRSLADLLACAKGKYFLGDPSTLLY